MAKMEFGADTAGGILIANGRDSVLYQMDTAGKIGYGFYYEYGTKITLSGWFIEQQGIFYWQLANNPAYYVEMAKPNSNAIFPGWDIESLRTYEANIDSAQKIVNAIIKNNKYILENNLVCAKFAYKLNAEELKTLKGLHHRLSVRNEALKSNEVLHNQSSGSPIGYDQLAAYLSKNSIGVVISTSTVIIISALVLTSLSAATYWAYKAYFDESEQDVKFSKALTKKLQSKLTPEEYEELKNETQGLVTKTKLNEKLGSWGTSLKSAGLLLLGAFVVLKAPGWIQSTQKKTK